MSEYLKEYNVVLETVGPLFVGSGKEINKKEYILKPNEIMVMDIPKLFSFFKKKGLERRFEEFFLNDVRMDLSKFLKDNRISFLDIDSYTKYRIRQSDTALARGTKISVMEFMRDAYGMPYIPGSSIKGMLRTILLCSDIQNDKPKYNELRRNIKDQAKNGSGRRNVFLNREQKQLEALAFNKLERSTKKQDAVNDIMSGIMVSDSKPIGNESMVLCQRLEYHLDGTEKRLNVLRECIMPRTNIHFTVTVDEKNCPYNMEDILASISMFNKIYNTVFRTKFSKMKEASKDTVYLGGGVGFVSKTIIYPLLGQAEGTDVIVDIFDKTNVPKNHKHYLDRRMGVSPHILKATRYEGELYHMGECRWRIV